MHQHQQLTGKIGLCCLCAILVASQQARSQDIVQGAAEVGITPESLVIAEVSPTVATTILAHIAEAEDLRANIASQRLLVNDAVHAVTNLAQQSADTADEDVIEAYQVALGQLSERQSELAALREQLFAEAMEGIPSETVETIVIWRAGAVYRVPPEFRVRSRTVEQWKQLERALRAERRAAQVGEELAPECAQVLGDVRSDPAVPQAAYNLEANLVAMAALFSNPGG